MSKTTWAECQTCKTNRVVAVYSTACGLQICAMCDIRHTAEHTCRTNQESAKVRWGSYEAYR